MDNQQTDNSINIPSPRKRWGLLLLVPLCAGMIVLFVFSMEWKDSLKIQRVLVDGAKSISAKEIFSLAAVPLKSSLFAIDLFEVQSRVMAQPFMKSVRVCRQFPDVLRIDVVEREPIASLNAGQLHYIDEEGVPLPSSTSQRKFDLPLISGISGIQNVQLGKAISSKEIFDAIEICQAAQSIDTTVYRLISEINMNNGNDIILYSSDVGVPIILGHGDVQKKLIMLEHFWMNYINSGDAEKLQYIDLRFDDQVVVKKIHSPERPSKKI